MVQRKHVEHGIISIFKIQNNIKVTKNEKYSIVGKMVCKNMKRMPFQKTFDIA